LNSSAPSAGDDLPACLAACRQAPGALEALGQLYARAEAELAAAAPACKGCGTCCDFDRHGHRLFVTTLELAGLARQVPPTPENLAAGRCPYQAGPRCLARELRPLGCRSYFCNEAGANRRQAIHEAVHQALVDLHRQCRLEYRYVDLIAGLRRLR
jgi:hypothetical protein